MPSRSWRTIARAPSSAPAARAPSRSAPKQPPRHWHLVGVWAKRSMRASGSKKQTRKETLAKGERVCEGTQRTAGQARGRGEKERKSRRHHCVANVQGQARRLCTKDPKKERRQDGSGRVCVWQKRDELKKTLGGSARWMSKGKRGRRLALMRNAVYCCVSRGPPGSTCLLFTRTPARPRSTNARRCRRQVPQAADERRGRAH